MSGFGGTWMEPDGLRELVFIGSGDGSDLVAGKGSKRGVRMLFFVI